MAQDPVLQREMFNPRDRSAKGSGITSMVDDGSSGMTREERLQMAKDMLAEAQMKQSPEYYFKTLAQGDRPAMTRPVASSAPPPAMQQMPAAQQMAQMQAAGVRPVGMADGGIVRRGFQEGGLNTIYPTIDRRSLSPEDVAAIEKSQAATFDLKTYGSGKLPENLMTDPDTGQTPEEKENLRLAQTIPGQNLSPDMNEYYDKKAEEILEQTYGSGRFKLKDVPEEATTAFGRFGAADVAADNKRKTEARERAKSEIKKRLMLEDVGGDTYKNLYNITKEESSAERAARQERQARQTATVEEFGVINRTPGRDDTLYSDPTRLAAGRLQRAEQGIAAARPTFEPTSGDLIVDSGIERESAQVAKDREAKGLASLRNMESGLDLGRGMADVEGDVPLIVNQGVAERAERKAIRIPEDPTLQGKATISGVPGAAAARDAVAQGQAGAGGGAAAQEPAKYSATTTLESIKSERAKEREDNFNMALIQAGLAMMGGKSSNALANIGEGGMQGIKQFAEQEREATREYREDVKGVREEERFARAEERAAAATKEDSRRFELTYGEGIRQFDENARRQNRQQEITENQFKQQYGLSVADAARNEKQFAKTHALSVQAAQQKIADTARSFVFEEEKLAINRAELLQRAEESKATTAQAIASRDAKKLESAAGLATQILNATQARIANLLGRQQENTRMGLDPDPAIAAEVQELKRQAEEAQSNFYALNESLGTKLPGSNVVEYGNLK